MAERDMTRELMQRAYAGERFDAEAGLAEVVRRAGRPPVDDAAVLVERRHTVNVRRRRRLALVGVFAGVVGVVLAAAAAAGSFGGGAAGLPVGTAPSPRGGGQPSGSLSAHPWRSGEPTPMVDPGSGGPGNPGGIAPVGLPSQCASGWKLEFVGGQFKVTDRSSNCPPVDPKRIWLVDDHSNGLLFPGSGEVYPTATTGTVISPPFSFTVPQIPALQPDHSYHLDYLPEGVHPTPGQDADAVLQQSMTISLSVFI